MLISFTYRERLLEKVELVFKSHIVRLCKVCAHVQMGTNTYEKTK